MKYAVAYIVIVNIAAFCLFGIDKSAAIKQKQRIPNRVLLLLAAVVLLLNSCGAFYTKISQDEAMQMMQEQEDYLIVDVRRPDEFAEGHIAGAINVPNEDITDEMPELLPDKDQLLLIYCRSGNRSKDASQKLADMGYTKVYEFGGINTWEGEIVTGE